MLKLTNHQLDCLIDYIKEKPVMYDKQHKNFRNTDVKKFWEEIADALEVDEQDCKKAWRSIRDQYGKSLKDAKLNADTERKPYKYSAKLQFLKDSFRHKTAIEHYDDDQTVDTLSNDMPSTSKRQRSPTPEPEDTFKRFSFELDPLGADDANSPLPNELNTNDNEEFSEFLKQLLSMNQNAIQVKTNGVHKFFENLADTLANLNIPNLELMEMQSKIFTFSLELVKDWQAKQNKIT